MSNQTIQFSYSGSGVKSLSVLGTVFYILSGVAFFAVVISAISEDNVINQLVTLFISAVLGLLFCAAVCKALSSIARTALYKRALLENEYRFVEYGEETIKEAVEIEAEK